MTSDRPHHRPMTPGEPLLRGDRGDVDPAALARRPTAPPPRPRCPRRRPRGRRRARGAPRRLRGPRDPRRAVVRRAGRLAGRLPVAPLPAAHWVYADPSAAARRVRAGAGRTSRSPRSSPAWSSRPVPTRSRAGRRGAQRRRGRRLRRHAVPGGGVRPGRAADGRAVPDEPADRLSASSYASDVSASRLITLADQLERAARLELTASLGEDSPPRSGVLLDSASCAGPWQPRVPN